MSQIKHQVPFTQTTIEKMRWINMTTTVIARYRHLFKEM